MAEATPDAFIRNFPTIGVCRVPIPRAREWVCDRRGVFVADDYREPVIRAISVDGILAACGARIENVRQVRKRLVAGAVPRTVTTGPGVTHGCVESIRAG